MKKVTTAHATPLRVRISKSQARFTRIRDPHGPDEGIGDFFTLLEVTALTDAVCIPVSIASGKKPTGFVYQIEGTGESSLSTAEISCTGAGVMQVVSGTIRYAQIQKGKTATFRIRIRMRGKVGKEYSIVFERIHWKKQVSDARYERYLDPAKSKILKFR